MVAKEDTEVLAARAVPILRALGRPACSVALGRLLHCDPSQVFRALHGLKNVRVIPRGKELTEFEYANG